MSNANVTTFGIEIECTLPTEFVYANNIRIGGYHRGIQIPGLPEGWTAQNDGSIRAGHGRWGVEVVSPVLCGAEGIRQVQFVVAWLKAAGASVNASTGLHVHVGFAGDVDALQRLVTMTANHEKGIYASTGTKSRENGSYCRPVRSNADMQQQFRDTDNCCQSSRYHVLNTTNYRRNATVEFRAFAGTLNIHKILGYVQLCIGLVNKALAAKRLIKWDSKPTSETSPIKKGGIGQTELNRLLFALGWNKGRVPTVWGQMDLPEGAPSIDECKRKLLEMAAKYDLS